MFYGEIKIFMSLPRIFRAMCTFHLALGDSNLVQSKIILMIVLCAFINISATLRGIETLSRDICVKIVFASLLKRGHSK